MDDDAPRYPLWVYGVVGLAIVLGAIWLLAAAVGLLLGLVKVAIVVVLSIALIAWLIGKRAER